MQIVLLERVVNLDNLSDVVRVKNGYACNFLVPDKQARCATDSAIKEFEARRAELGKLVVEKLVAVQAEDEKLNGLTLQLSQKTGMDGHLFGSVTSHGIVDALVTQGFKIGKAQVRIPDGPPKTVGDHPVAVSLHTDVAVDMTMSVQDDAT